MTSTSDAHPKLPVAAIPSDNTQGITAARAIIAAAEDHDGVSPVSDQAMLAVVQGQRQLLLFGGDDAVAVGIVGAGEVDLVVHPQHRRRGIGAAALDELVARGSGSEQAPIPESGALRAWAHGHNPAATALLSRAHFAPVRSLFKMVLDPALLPQDSRDATTLPPPPGFQLRTFQDDRDAEDWVRVNAAAFADHPEQGRMTVADFRLITQEDWFEPRDLLLLAASRSDGTPGDAAGSTWIKTTADECELYAIGIHPDHAGHGLGRYLLNVTLARMAQHQPNRVSLYVDGDNERATKMYETAGFTIDSRSQQWERSATSVASVRMDT